MGEDSTRPEAGSPTRGPSPPSGGDRLRQAVLTGSAAHRRPVSGCRCPACTCSTTSPTTTEGPDSAPPAWCAPSGLLLPGLLLLDGDDPEPGAGPQHDGPAPARLRTHRPGVDEQPTARWLEAGERTESGTVRVVALPAGHADGSPDPDRVVLVLGEGSRTLLWAVGGGPLPEVTLQALADAGLNAAVLGSTAPENAPENAPERASEAAPGEQDATPGEQDPDPALALAHQVARLRRVRALTDDAVLVAAGLPHTGPVPGRFARTAAEWGMQVLPDGSRLWPEYPRPGPGHVRLPDRARGMPSAPRTVVLGAAGSGKSLVAESLLAALPEVVYAATGPRPDDADPSWTARVERHRRRRPPWWPTVESPDLPALLGTAGPPLLVDSLGTWLTALLDEEGCWQDRPGWAERVWERVDDLVRAWRQAARPVLAVTEEVGWGVVPATASGGRFRDALGRLNRRICDQSERVLLVVAGRVVDLDTMPVMGGTGGGQKGWR